MRAADTGRGGIGPERPRRRREILGEDLCVRRKHCEKSQGTLRMVGSQRQGVGRTGTEERRREPTSFGGRKTGE